MYTAPVDATLGEAEWRPFVDANRFGHLVAAGRDRDVPVVVPTQFCARRGHRPAAPGARESGLRCAGREPASRLERGGGLGLHPVGVEGGRR